MMDKIVAGAAQQANALRLHQVATQGDTPDERRYSVMPTGSPARTAPRTAPA